MIEKHEALIERDILWDLLFSCTLKLKPLFVGKEQKKPPLFSKYALAIYRLSRHLERKRREEAKRLPKKVYISRIKPFDKNLLLKKRDILIFMAKISIWFTFFHLIHINSHFLALKAYFYTCPFISTRL